MSEAIKLHGQPQIVNTDQGSQFTSGVFTELLKDKDRQISMEGNERAIDTIFIERLWRSVKYENIYLHSYEDGVRLYQGLKDYFCFHNNQRLQQSLVVVKRRRFFTANGQPDPARCLRISAY